MVLRAPRVQELPRLAGRLALDGLLEVSCPLDPERDARVAEVGGRVVGTCWVRRVSSLTVFSAGGAEAFFEHTVEPAHAGGAVPAELVRWAVARARASGAVRELFTDADSPKMARLLGSVGFQPDRTLHVMVNQDPAAVGAPRWPAGTRQATVSPGADLVDAVTRACDAVFAGLPHYQGATRAVVERVVSHPSTDPALCVVALRGALVAGFCYSRLERAGTATCGWVEDLGVAPSARRIGLGRALLRRSVQALVERGASSVVLGVDAANTPARRLYETSGFTLSGALSRHRLELA